MVDTVLDPLRPTPLTLSEVERDEIRARIANGELPADWLEQCDAAAEQNVFGHDHKKDRHGQPIEQGIGAPGNMTSNSIAAFKRYCSDHPDYLREVARMEADLVKSNERRKAEAAANDRRR